MEIDLMAYMGDLPSKYDNFYHVSQILSMGMKHTNLSDEIFFQICKQVHYNPKRQNFILWTPNG
jgi:hypothetical protein